MSASNSSHQFSTHHAFVTGNICPVSFAANRTCTLTPAMQILALSGRSEKSKLAVRLHTLREGPKSLHLGPQQSPLSHPHGSNPIPQAPDLGAKTGKYPGNYTNASVGWDSTIRYWHMC
eukprot:1148127-Pelagomonas_calceolata.AAC.1